MSIGRNDSEALVAFERGCQSVRDETDGNPYRPYSMCYDQFERGITQEKKLAEKNLAQLAP